MSNTGYIVSGCLAHWHQLPLCAPDIWPRNIYYWLQWACARLLLCRFHFVDRKNVNGTTAYAMGTSSFSNGCDYIFFKSCAVVIAKKLVTITFVGKFKCSAAIVRADFIDFSEFKPWSGGCNNKRNDGCSWMLGALSGVDVVYSLAQCFCVHGRRGWLIKWLVDIV